MAWVLPQCRCERRVVGTDEQGTLEELGAGREGRSLPRLGAAVEEDPVEGAGELVDEEPEVLVGRALQGPDGGRRRAVRDETERARGREVHRWLTCKTAFTVVVHKRAEPRITLDPETGGAGQTLSCCLLSRFGGPITGPNRTGPITSIVS